MHVLITCVGSRDPYWNRAENQLYNPDSRSAMSDPGPILAFYQTLVAWNQRPDRVYLISTAEGDEVRAPTRRNGDDTEAALKALGAVAVRHWSLPGVNPTNYEDLIPWLRRYIDQVLAETQASHPTYIINESPGTPQMRAVLYSFVHSGIIPARLYQAHPPKQIHIEPLYEDQYKKIAIGLIGNYAFRPARDLFEKLAQNAIDAQRAVVSALFGQLCSVYGLWSVFEYRAACDAMHQLFQQTTVYRPELHELHSLVARQHTVLQELASADGPMQTLVLDLYHKALQLHAIGDYTDCVWRCAGVQEQVTIGRVLTHFQRQAGLTPEPKRFGAWLVEQSAANAYVRQFVERHYADGRPPSFLGVGEAGRIVEWLGEDLVDRLRRRVEWLRNLRNKAIHPLEPVSAAEADEAVDVAKAVLHAEYGPGIEAQLVDYPFSVRQFEALIALAHTLI